MNSDLIEVTLIPWIKRYPKHNNSSDYYIYVCKTEDDRIEKNMVGGQKAVTIKGNMPELEIGMPYKALLKFADKHETFGVSYWVESIFQDIPTDAKNQKAFLSALLTERQVEEIYKIYSEEDDIVQLIIDGKFDYEKVHGIGPVYYERIRQKLIENMEYRELISLLGGSGIRFDKVVSEFGSAKFAVFQIRENPYNLMKVSGIGFIKADAVAQRMGIEKTNPFRIDAGIKHVITEEHNDGHTYVYSDELIKRCTQILKIDSELIQNRLSDTLDIIIIENRVALQHTYQCELTIANKIHELLKNSEELKFDPEDFIKRMEDKYQIKLTDQQKSFFNNIKKHAVNLLVGYAGTGKSQMMSLLKDLLDEMNKTHVWFNTSVYLTPTGKSAKVLTKYLKDRTAYTIHKHIGYGLPKELYDEVEVTQDFIIVDETSMVDIFILSSLLQKIKNKKARILFVGDAFQLPSVSAGNCLHDMIESGVIPTTKLDIVFRQSEGGILDIATRVRKGEKFIENDFEGKQLFGNNLLIHSVDQKHMVDGYKYYYNQLLKKYRPEDIMVLSPRKKFDLGTVAINKTIQEIVNPAIEGITKEIGFGENNFLRTGDYVINTRNVDLNLVNGDTGIVIDFIYTSDKNSDNKSSLEKYNDKEEKSGILIDFGFEQRLISFEDKHQLLHAWCLTIHKSQGSSAKSVLIVLDKSHKFQVTANLLYTALTRAEENAILLCQADVINYAMRNVENLMRNTFLCEMLKGKIV
jgi:ATP-dependent exoDNAse (exonuclease V), alpha subunit - helicase superfamily I member